MPAAILSLRRNSFPTILQLLRLRCLSTASPAPCVMEKYLVESCGFSPAEAARAAKASKSIEQSQSTSNPDEFISFMRSQGFGADHIRRMITKVPRLLVLRVKKTLVPKLESFRSIGLSESDFIEVLATRPHLLACDVVGSVVPKLRMWETILGSREVLAEYVLKRSFLLSSDTEKVVSNIKFLTEEYGIPRETIYLSIRKDLRFILQKTDALRRFAVRTEELGVPRKSEKFLLVLSALSRIGIEDLDAKLKITRSIGCSDPEFLTAILKAPKLGTMSQEILLEKVDFLFNKLGLSPSYFSRRPDLLLLSLENRIIPRVRVMEVLKSEGLLKHQQMFLFKLSDRQFRKYVLCHTDKVPKLRDML